LLENARRVAEEAVALHRAEQCPEGTATIILDGSQLGLQIHESIGHPIELDRVLGMEANFAGTSFLTLEKLGKLKYGSELVNVVADARQEHGPGLGTFAYDDEGVAAQSTPIITNGLFTGYLSSRETAHTIGATRSGGTLRAEGWNRLPIDSHDQRQHSAGREAADAWSNSSPRPTMASTWRRTVLVDRRQALQLSVRMRDRWEIKHGKRGADAEESFVFRHHDGVLEFDGRDLLARPMDAVGNSQLRQRPAAAGDGHRTWRSPARFRNIRVGSAYSGKLTGKFVIL
jgi:TldD protein